MLAHASRSGSAQCGSVQYIRKFWGAAIANPNTPNTNTVDCSVGSALKRCLFQFES